MRGLENSLEAIAVKIYFYLVLRSHKPGLEGRLWGRKAACNPFAVENGMLHAARSNTISHAVEISCLALKLVIKGIIRQLRSCHHHQSHLLQLARPTGIV